jgi:predicted unusual protein kinase regulating ubiquinone biosynthesis (AarF/ABC1/UbiB family)
MFKNKFFFLTNVFYIFMFEAFLYFTNMNTYQKYINNVILKLINENVLFVKLFQSMSSMKTLPNDVLEIFKKNTNNVLYHPDELDHETMAMVLRKYNLLLLSDVPINAGMVSVVYMGKKKDTGEKVIIKIKKRDIKNRLIDGCEKFIFIYKLLTYCVIYNDILLSFKSFTESTEYLISQCNFKDEINALTANKKVISTISDDIIIPKVYNDDEDIDEDVNFILMEYLEGQFSFNVSDTTEKREYARQLITYITNQYFFMDYIHSDLHLGNVICMKRDGELKTGIIDFGMHIQLSPNLKKTLLRILGMLYTEKDNGLDYVQYVNDFIGIPIDFSNYSKVEYQQMNKIFKDMFEKIREGILIEQDINVALNEFMRISRIKTVFNKQTIQILLSLTMTNSTIFNLLNYDTDIFEKYCRDIITDILMN